MVLGDPCEGLFDSPHPQRGLISQVEKKHTLQVSLGGFYMGQFFPLKPSEKPIYHIPKDEISSMQLNFFFYERDK